MRKKEGIRLLGMAFAALALLCLYLFLLQKNGKSQEEAGIVVYQLEEGEIERLEFSGLSGPVALVKRREEWKYELDESFPLNQRFVETMLEKTAVLRAKRKVGQGREHFGEYGLDAPSNIIRLEAGSKEKVIRLGNINSATGDCYLNMEGSDEIYIVDATFPNVFSAGLNDLASRETLPGMTIDTMTALEIRSASSYLRFEKGEAVESAQGQSSWSMRQAGSAGAEGGSGESQSPDGGGAKEPLAADDARVQELLAQVIRLRYEKMVQYAQEESQMEDYGLDHPQLLLSVCYQEEKTQEEREFVLKVGNQMEDGAVYAVYPQDGAGIYTMKAEALEPLFYLAAEDFLSLNVAALKGEELTGLQIRTEGSQILFEIKKDGAKEDARHFMNGREISQKEFNGFYYQLYALEADKRAADLNSQLTQKEVLSIVYRRKEAEGGDVTAEFIPYDQNYYGVRVNGRASLLINRQKVNQLLAAISQLSTLEH